MRVLDLTEEAAAHQPDLATLPELTEQERQLAIRTWRGRMVNEHCSAQVFASLVPQLMNAAVSPTLQAQVPAMIADEYRHARQCAGVVLALGGEPVAPLPEIAEVPRHEEVEPLEGVMRNILSVCCMSETIAVSIIRAEQAELSGTALGDCLDSILADEVQHARFGWGFLGRYLSEMDANALERLSRYLEVAFAHQILWEIPKLPLQSSPVRAEVAEAGVCDGGEARSLFFETFEALIIPKLESAGLKAGRAWTRALDAVGKTHPELLVGLAA